MGMGSDDDIGARLCHLPGKFLLISGGRGDIFRTPVREDQNHIGKCVRLFNIGNHLRI